MPGLCWMWHGVPFARQGRPVVGVLRLCWLLPASFDCFCCPRASVLRPSITCLAVFLCEGEEIFVQGLCRVGNFVFQIDREIYHTDSGGFREIPMLVVGTTNFS